jgi:hypothetical protein
MAKRASNKPAAKAAATKTAAVSTALPTSDESAQSPEQGMTAPLSPEVFVLPPVETPPGVSGVSSPVAPLSDDDNGDNAPEIIVGSESVGAADSPPGEVQAVPVEHPAIALAQSFVTPHGVPASGHQHYYTPPPPELRKPVKA